MSGILNKNIIHSFRMQFEANCIELLLNSHTKLLGTGRDFKDTNENAITVQLIGYMKSNPTSTDYKIDITREYYIDGDSAYSGSQDPDTSPRIDIRLMTWTSPEKFEYFFEAKNLYERDFVKAGNITPINSKTYQKRYINTGMQNFINGKYPRGCLIGYVLNGNPERIAESINGILKSASRNNECLLKQTNSGKTQYCFISTCVGNNITSLIHYFLAFN